jgi:hypothetical protein
VDILDRVAGIIVMIGKISGRREASASNSYTREGNGSPEVK